LHPSELSYRFCFYVSWCSRHPKKFVQVLGSPVVIDGDVRKGAVIESHRFDIFRHIGDADGSRVVLNCCMMLLTSRLEDTAFVDRKRTS
jgi:hypothetical protein